MATSQGGNGHRNGTHTHRASLKPHVKSKPVQRRNSTGKDHAAGHLSLSLSEIFVSLFFPFSFIFCAFSACDR